MKKSFLYLVILFLCLCLFFSITHKKERIVERVTIDSIEVVRKDTLFYPRDTFIYETIIDTQYIDTTSKNGLKLVFTQRYYNNDKYAIWVSGYKPTLDSAIVYENVVYKTIYKNNTKEIYPRKNLYYIDLGISKIKNEISPSLGFSVKLKNDMLVGAKVGYFDKDLYYGINVGFNLNRK